MVTGEVSFGLALAGGWAGGSFGGAGLGGSEAGFFPGCCSGDSEEGRLIPAMPPTGRMEEGKIFEETQGKLIGLGVIYEVRISRGA